MSEHAGVADIIEQGWTNSPFALPEGDRAEYARLANTVISIAIEDTKVKESLAFEINPGHEVGKVRTGTFGIGYARNSTDAKVYLHTGFQSQAHAAEVLPGRSQPAVMSDFWEANNAMLQEIEERTVGMLKHLGAPALQASVFSQDIDRRNVHLRTVRYVDALRAPVGAEVVSGHADLGLATLHLYETHGGWFYGAPYSSALILAEDSPERRAGVRALRERLSPLTQHENSVPFFLGANWHTFPYVPGVLRDLPACYHAGFRPESAKEDIFPYAESVTNGTDDRVSVISFMHPNGDLLKNGEYTPATVSNCRPEYQ